MKVCLMFRNILRLSFLAILCSVFINAGGALAASNEQFLADRVLGDKNAPVTITEYSSFTCPHCADFHAKILPQLKREYIDTGKVKLIMKSFPLDNAALNASVLAYCAP